MATSQGPLWDSVANLPCLPQAHRQQPHISAQECHGILYYLRPSSESRVYKEF